MIRRDVPLTDDPTKWLLISQIEHARLSGELATAWQQTPSSSGFSLDKSVRSELLAAIHHHDDGWAAWESDPVIDPPLGQPFSFLDLPREESLVIWQDSIDLCRQIGPLAAWVVAGHFVHLLHDSDDANRPFAQQWLRDTESLQDNWLAEWIQADRTQNSLPIAEGCLFALRLFDWLSLWLCCQCPAITGDGPAEPMIVDEGPLQQNPIRFVADRLQNDGEPRLVRVTPWPFDAPRLSLDALGYTVPKKQYATAEALTKNRSPQRLRWHLVPE